MAKAPANPSEQLQELISERQRYEAWLNSLHARRDSAPAHVVSRIEEDYRKRLSKIGEELSARAGELRERTAGLSTRLAEIRIQESARRDERAEAEIRTAVGEFSPGQWAEISERVDRELSTLEADRQVLERDLLELEGVLRGVLGEAPPATAAVAQPDATRTAPPSPPAQAAGGGATQQSRPAPRPAPVPHKVAPAPERAPTAPAAATATASAARQPAPQPAAPPLAAGEAQRRGPDPRAQKRTDASQREGQEKTLMCNECGTSNYPTEWYCEACGAELATL